MTDKDKVTKPRAKRKLSAISFEQESAHLALVSKQQGGGANNRNFSLLLKASDTQEQPVVNTAETPVIKAQETESEALAKVIVADTSTHASVEKIEADASVTTIKSTKSKEPNMTKEIKAEDTVVIIEKSAQELSLELLQKSLDDSKVELQKALDTIAEFQKEKQEQIQKSKTAQFTAVIKDEKLQAPIVKAALSLESEDDFVAFLAAITSMQTNIETTQGFIEKSALFQEQGASTSEEPKSNESAVAKLVKSRLAANK